MIKRQINFNFIYYIINFIHIKSNKIKDNNTIMIFPYFCNKCKKRTVYRENRTSPF